MRSSSNKKSTSRATVGSKAKGSDKDDGEWLPPLALRALSAAKCCKQHKILLCKTSTSGKPRIACRMRCGKDFARWTDEVRHIATAACRLVPKQKSKRSATCLWCFLVLSRKDALDRHQKNSCRICPDSKRCTVDWE